MESMELVTLKDRALVVDTAPVRRLSTPVAVFLVGLIAGACATTAPPSVPLPAPPPVMNEVAVIATAYNSVVAQTDSDPTMTAHGVRLRPGMQVIAVSRDLEALGLGEGAKVRIEGLPGEWTVVDRMAKRWKRRIDIYMGVDIEGARAFGRREVDVQWLAAAE